MQKVKLKANGEKDELIGTFFISFPNDGWDKSKYDDFSVAQIKDKLFKKYGPKYIQKVRKAIFEIDIKLKLEISNPNLHRDSVTRIDNRTLNKIKALDLEDEDGNILEGEGDQKYPGIDLELEVSLKYLDCVMSNMEKSLWVNLIPIGLSYPPSESPQETKGKNDFSTLLFRFFGCHDLHVNHD